MDAYLNIQTIVRHKMKQIAKPPDDSANIESQWYLVGPSFCSERKQLLFNHYTGSTRAKTVFFL